MKTDNIHNDTKSRQELEQMRSELQRARREIESLKKLQEGFRDENIADSEAASKTIPETSGGKRSRWELALEASDLGLWDIDLKTGKIVSNECWAAMLGYTLKELEPLTNETWEKLLHPDDKDQAIARFKDYLDGKTDSYESEFRLKGRDGSWIWILDKGKIVERDKQGRPLRVIGTQRDLSRRKKIEQTLRQSEEKFRGLFEMIQDGVARIDMEGHIIEYNPAFQKMLGYSDEELHNLSVWDITADKWKPQQEQVIWKMIVDGNSGIYEKEYIRKDGSLLTVAVNAILIRDHAGNPAGIWGTIRDMTEAKKAQEAIIDTQRKFELAVRSSGMSILTVGPDLRYSWAYSTHIYNDSEIIGYTAEDHQGRKLGRPIMDLYRRVFATGQPARALFDIKDKSGDMKVYDIMAEPLLDSNGKIISLLVATVEVTERENIKRKLETSLQELKKANLALKHSNERYRALFNSMINSYTLNEIIMDDKGEPVDAIFLDVNPAFERLTGLKRDEIIGKREFEIFPFFDRSWLEACNYVALTGESLVMNQHLISSDRYFNLKIFRPAKGQFAVIREDITDRIKAEEKVRLQQEQIQNKNEELAAQNEELRVIQDELEQRLKELNEAQGALDGKVQELKAVNDELQRFAYVASHDLQEPLRMIASYLQLLERRYGEKLDKDASEFIGFAVDGAKRLQRMIESLLEYSRIDTRGNPFEPVAVGKIVQEALTNLKMVLDESNAIITRTDLPIIMGDASQLTSLFQNLIANSLKFKGLETPQIEISARRDGSNWVFAIKDNGIGIDPKYYDRIFIIFQRLHGHDYPGTGIGLSISKRIVERHGGKMWVESKIGEGTTFYFTIPLYK